MIMLLSGGAISTIVTAYLLWCYFVLVAVATQHAKIAYLIIYFFPCTVPVFLRKFKPESCGYLVLQ